MKVQMLTKEIEERLPMLGKTDGSGFDAIVQVKFFQPWGQWTWYATEAAAVTKDGDEKPLPEVPESERQDVIFFGLVIGFEQEFGNFSLNELNSVKGPGGLTIERDRGWQPRPLRDCSYVDVRW